MENKLKYVIFIILLLAVTSFKFSNPRTVYAVDLDTSTQVVETIKNKTKEGYKVVSLTAYDTNTEFSDFILIMEK